MADYLHADHTEVIINKDIVLDALESVIAMLGTWDITTIRASRGEDIQAACGLLSTREQEKQAE